MGKNSIDFDLIAGIVVTPLKKVEDERGVLLHMLRRDALHFQEFGEVYFSITNPGIIKGWKLHKEMVQNFAVPIGELKLVIFDGREGSITYGKVNEFLLSRSEYNLITIPNKLWYSFKTISSDASMIANCASIPHRTGESLLKNLTTSDIPYDWH